MDADEVVALVASWEHVEAFTPGPGSAAPEIAWGDTFFTYAPPGAPPAQPFATVVTKDYPDDRTSRLDREGVFRVSIGAGREAADGVADGPGAPDELDRLHLHPVYGAQGWVAVLNPGERTAEAVRGLLRQAYEAARARYDRRTAT